VAFFSPATPFSRKRPLAPGKQKKREAKQRGLPVQSGSSSDLHTKPDFGTIRHNSLGRRRSRRQRWGMPATRCPGVRLDRGDLGAGLELRELRHALVFQQKSRMVGGVVPLFFNECSRCFSTGVVVVFLRCTLPITLTPASGSCVSLATADVGGAAVVPARCP
jgi:hypothetical protein